MIYHVLPGDAQAAEFIKSDIEGDIIICRECLAVGDVDAENLADFWEQRAKFILAEYGEDDAEYHELVADELAKLLDADESDEVNLWFEYELFCSVNYWFCLFLLSDSKARVFRVAPSQLSYEERWNGFAEYEAADLEKAFDQRVELSAREIETGRDLWLAFRSRNDASLLSLARDESAAFPYLAEVCEAAVARESRPPEIVAEIMFEGKTELGEVFDEFKKRAGVYGYGDLQVERLIQRNI